MEMVLKNGFCEMEQNEMLEVDGGLIMELGSFAYGIDMYNYYKETKYVASYNDTVVAAGRGDLVKPNPAMPTYNPLYIFTR